MEAVWGICGECGNNFLIQLVREPTRENALLDLKFVSREGPVGDVVAGGHLGHVMRERVFDTWSNKENCYLGLPKGRL